MGAPFEQALLKALKCLHNVFRALLDQGVQPFQPRANGATATRRCLAKRATVVRGVTATWRSLAECATVMPLCLCIQDASSCPRQTPPPCQRNSLRFARSSSSSSSQLYPPPHNHPRLHFPDPLPPIIHAACQYSFLPVFPLVFLSLLLRVQVGNLFASLLRFIGVHRVVWRVSWYGWGFSACSGGGGSILFDAGRGYQNCVQAF